MSAPLVSIVLPTYKRAHLLGQAIRSILAQTYANLELIVVDDNSPDDTAQVVASFDDPRIRYVRNDPNLKLPRALNRGFSLARGDFLTWTSDDNLMLPAAIEKMAALLARGEGDFVYADYWLFSEQDAEGHPSDPRRAQLPDTLQLEKGNHIGACFLYTRRLYQEVGEYDPELFLVEDFDYFLRAAKQFRFIHLGEPLYYFRRDEHTLYLSRYAEVKASDALVRFKNGLLDEPGLIDFLAALVMRHMEGLKHPLLRSLHTLFHGRSYRLEQMNRRWADSWLRQRIASGVAEPLRSYRDQRSSFGETRNALMQVMTGCGVIRD